MKADKKVTSNFPWWEQPNEENPIWKKISYIILALIAAFLFYFSFTAGPNGDDLYQNYYADNVLNFYKTMGEDTTVLYHPQGHLKFYGGYYEIPSALINKTFGFIKYDKGYHVTRHLLNSVFGFLAILAMVMLGKQLLNWRAAAIIAIVFLCSPVFMFHAAINPKDIPFAAGMSLSIWAMWNWFRKWPDPGWKSTILLGLAIGSALAVRIGGLLLFGYLGLFGLLMLYQFRSQLKKISSILRLGLYALAAFLISYVICIAFWPYALLGPVKNVIESFLMFNEFDTAIRVLFQGENVLSNRVSMFYTPIWMYKTIPVISLLGFVASLAFANKLIHRIGLFAYMFLIFTVLFPLAYIVFENSNVYDAWRHSLFIYPPMVCLAGIAIDTLWKKYLPKGSKYYFTVPIIIALLAVHPISHMIKYPHYAYVFFNILNTSPGQVTGYYETDYWRMSAEKAVSWMEKEGLFKNASVEKPIKISTNSLFQVDVALRSRGYGKEIVKTSYARYDERYNEDWDYGIFPSRFIDAEELKYGNYPDSYALKTLYVNGTPVCVILKSDGQNIHTKAFKAVRNKEVAEAINLFKEELELHPDNLPAVRFLADILMQTGDKGELRKASSMYRDLRPESLRPNLYDAMFHILNRDYESALEYLDEMIKSDDTEFEPFYYKSMALAFLGKKKEAIESLEKTIELNPTFTNAYRRISQLYKDLGNKEQADKYARIADYLSSQ